MGKKGIIVLVIVVVAVAAGFWYGNRMVATRSPAGGGDANLRTLTLAGGAVTLSYPADRYGLATTADELLVRAYIPPCEEGFAYCLYHATSTYAGTNFESAGLRINLRKDLADQTSCLETEPSGYENLAPATTTEPGYATGVFGPFTNAGAGHYAVGAIYRLWTDSGCYEFETRIGETQFLNYPSGTIREFTETDRATIMNELKNILDTMTVAPDGAQTSFPSLRAVVQ